MVDVYIEIMKQEMNETLQAPGLTFEQAHFMIRNKVKELSKIQKYETEALRYYEREQELQRLIQEKAEELNQLKNKLADNDQKMYEAIKKL